MKHLLIILCLCVTTIQAQSESYALKFYDTTKVNPKVLNKDFTVEIGDSSKVGFDPSFAVSAWDGECVMRINLSTTANPMNGASRVVSSLGGKNRVTLSTTDVDHDMYAKEDGFEWEIILNKKPASNVFTYDIETENLVYAYNVDSLDLFNTPDSVNGSYVAYHATKKDNYTYVSPKDTTYENYMTGKAFSIWRPKAWDAVGTDTTWCSLYVDSATGELSITVPQKFLDDATYPVVIDPTFGYETAGSSFTTPINLIFGHVATPSSAGTLDSISAYLIGFDAAQNVKCATYNWSDNTKIDTSEIKSLGVDATGWTTFDLLLDAPIHPDTSYLNVAWAESGGGGMRLYFDLSGTGWKHKVVTYGAWPDPLTGTGSFDRSVSIYAWYTVAVTGPPDYIHGPDGAGVVHGISGGSRLHGP